jgi:sporulation protein YunB
MRRIKRRRPGKKGRTLATLLFLSVIVLIIAVFLHLVNTRLMPTVITSEELRINSRLNQAIDAAVSALSVEYGGGLDSEDFYKVASDSEGRVLSLSADTLLINEVCAKLSRFIDKFLSEDQNDFIKVPLGALLGIDWLANVGPDYKISVRPAGTTNIEYKTSFEAGGINQINFQVWADVSTVMLVVNPLEEREVKVERSIALINTVFAGEIPGLYVPGMTGGER